MLRKIAKNYNTKKARDDDIDNDTKEFDINKNEEVAETYNGKLVIDSTNDPPPPQDNMTTTTTTAAAEEEGGDDDNMGAEDGKDEKEADKVYLRRDSYSCLLKKPLS